MLPNVAIGENDRVSGLATFALAALAVAVLLLLMRNASRLFVVRVDRGRLVHLRGRAPKGLLRDIADVVRQRPIDRASIDVRVQDGLAAVRVDGDVTEGEKQRLRNVVGTWPVQKIRSAPYRSGALSI